MHHITQSLPEKEQLLPLMPCMTVFLWLVEASSLWPGHDAWITEQIQAKRRQAMEVMKTLLLLIATQCCWSSQDETEQVEHFVRTSIICA